MRRAVFLDRDGVLNEAIVRDGRAYAPIRLHDFRVVPAAAGQVARLRAAGLVTIVFTNQPEIARGTLSPAHLNAMHATLRAEVELDDIVVCPHDPRDGCLCCKPAPGMIHRAAGSHGIELTRSFVVGDRWRDIGAGLAAGCFTILLKRDYSACEDAHLEVDDLRGAVDQILSRL